MEKEIELGGNGEKERFRSLGAKSSGGYVALADYGYYRSLLL